MEAAVFVAIFFSLITAFVLAFVLCGHDWKAAEEKARERRMVEHKMNARLLRFNL
jgi:hypothetical protein